MISRSSRIALFILFAGFMFRLAYVQFVNPVARSIFSDMANYVYVADLIKNGEWRITHFFQPIGFPYVILLIKMITPDWTRLLEWIQIITGTISCWLVWKTAKDSFGEKVGLVSLTIASLHLPWISFAGLALAETLFIFFLSILAWLSLRLIRKPSMAISVLWTLTFFMAFLMKGTHVFYGPLFLLGLFYYQRKSAFKHIAVISVLMGSLLIGHGLFTKAKVGKFSFSASAGGLNFVEGKCPLKNNADNAGYSWLSPLYYQLGMTEQKKWDMPFTDSSYFMGQGFKCIQQNPYVLIQSLEGIPFLFVGNTLWPANQSRLKEQMRLYELLFACFSIIGIAVFIRFFKYSTHREEDMIVWLLPIISVFLCVYIFKSEIRFRIPFDVWIIPVAVKGWSELLKARLT